MPAATGFELASEIMESPEQTHREKRKTTFLQDTKDEQTGLLLKPLTHQTKGAKDTRNSEEEAKHHPHAPPPLQGKKAPPVKP